MHIDPIAFVTAFVLGALAGLGYLAMLWYSVRDLERTRHPVVRVLGGAVLRIVMLMGVFYLVMDGRWERLIACFAGFLVVRAFVTRLADARIDPRTGAGEERR